MASVWCVRLMTSGKVYSKLVAEAFWFPGDFCSFLLCRLATMTNDHYVKIVHWSNVNLFASLKRTNYKYHIVADFQLIVSITPKVSIFIRMLWSSQRAGYTALFPPWGSKQKKQPRGECIELQHKPMHFEMYLYQSFRERLRAVSQS